jgi:GntR family transcriptional repressor for pyruvate dehydrogenase complex
MTTRRSSSASSLRPVERSRVHEQLVEMLCEHIDDADLQPGDRPPPERELAAQVGVSRASISRRPWPRRFWASSTSGTARARSVLRPRSEQQVLAALRARQRRLPEIVEGARGSPGQTRRARGETAQRGGPGPHRRCARAYGRGVWGGGLGAVDERFHAAVTAAALGLPGV